MSTLVWPVAIILVAALGGACYLNGTYNLVQRRRLDQESGCACPTCDAGGSCAKDGAL